LTAAAILTGIDFPESPPPPPALPPNLRRLVLAERAAAEAAHISTARLLQGAPAISLRPAVAVAGRCVRRLICAFELAVTDSGGLPVWVTAIGVEVPSSLGQHEPPTRQMLRQAIDRVHRKLIHTAVMGAAAATTGGTVVLRATAVLGLAREHAIVTAVRRRHARIAADLLQPGLFDRRTERLAASQALVLEEALGRCGARIEALSRLQDSRQAPPALRFAVFVG
jgi:hypothetical protein